MSRLHYSSHLKPYSQKLRKAGNLSEVLLWNKLKGKALGYPFLRQRPIGKYIVDFYCHALSFAIEIDGATSHDMKIDADLERQREIESEGIKLVRFLDSDVRYNMSGVVEILKQEILRLANSAPPF